MQKEIGWLLKEKYNDEPDNNFYADIKRLKMGEPLDYIIGFTEFLGCRIDLSRKPLVPRPETEFWLGRVLKEINGEKVLDIFSGSGCIGIAILKNTKIRLCDLVDREGGAIEQIKINCEINKIDSKRYKVIQSDVFESVRGKYDYVFANPPYIAKSRTGKIQKSVLRFEPKKALFCGKDGLFYIKKFLRDAKKHLNIGGKIYMEFSPEQKEQIEALIKKYNYMAYEFHRDQYGRWRWVMIK